MAKLILNTASGSTQTLSAISDTDLASVSRSNLALENAARKEWVGKFGWDIVLAQNTAGRPFFPTLARNRKNGETITIENHFIFPPMNTENQSYLENVKRVSREAVEKRRLILNSIAELEKSLTEIDGRKKAQRGSIENRIKQERKWVERIEEDIHTFDTLETFADEVQEMDEKINELCELRKTKFPLYLQNSHWFKGYFYI